MTHSVSGILLSMRFHIESERVFPLREDLSQSSFQPRGRGRFWMSLVLSLAVLGSACVTSRPVQPSIAKTPVTIEQKSTIDLGLRINETEFLRLARAGPRWGVLPKTPDKEKLACPSWSPGICMGEYSSNFIVAVNGPMVDFMFRHSQTANPAKPVKIIFVEDWIKAEDGSYVAGGTNILADGIDIAVSLKALAWNSFKIMENERTLTVPNASEYFEGSMSILASRTAVHELGHGGAQVKRLGLKPDTSAAEAVHMQIYSFEEQYDALVHKAATQGFPEGGLMFGAQPGDQFNRLAYMNQIYKEAQSMGLSYPTKPN